MPHYRSALISPFPIAAEVAARVSTIAAITAVRNGHGLVTLRLELVDGKAVGATIVLVDPGPLGPRLGRAVRFDLTGPTIAERRAAWTRLSAALGGRTLAGWAAATYLAPRLADELAALDRRAAPERRATPRPGSDRRTAGVDPLRRAIERRAVLDLHLLTRDIADAFPSAPFGRVVGSLAISPGGLTFERLWLSLRRAGLVADSPTDARDAALLAALLPALARFTVAPQPTP